MDYFNSIFNLIFNGKSNDKMGTKQAIPTIDVYSES